MAGLADEVDTGIYISNVEPPCARESLPPMSVVGVESCQCPAVQPRVLWTSWQQHDRWKR